MYNGKYGLVMSHFKQHIDTMLPLHNHICILHDIQLVRLVGVHKDDYDYYYTVKSLDTSRGKFYASALGHIVSLKGLYPEERYDYMDKIFEMNGSGPEEEFSITSDNIQY